MTNLIFKFSDGCSDWAVQVACQSCDSRQGSVYRVAFCFVCFFKPCDLNDPEVTLTY
mgnify:CR=1 FL=1